MTREISLIEAYEKYRLTREQSKAILDIVESGKKYVIKERITKNKAYINVYVYDKFTWKYLLTRSVRVI